MTGTWPLRWMKTSIVNQLLGIEFWEKWKRPKIMVPQSSSIWCSDFEWKWMNIFPSSRVTPLRLHTWRAQFSTARLRRRKHHLWARLESLVAMPRWTSDRPRLRDGLREPMNHVFVSYQLGKFGVLLWHSSHSGTRFGILRTLSLSKNVVLFRAVFMIVAYRPTMLQHGLSMAWAAGLVFLQHKWKSNPFNQNIQNFRQQIVLKMSVSLGFMSTEASQIAGWSKFPWWNHRRMSEPLAADTKRSSFADMAPR